MHKNTVLSLTVMGFMCIMLVGYYLIVERPLAPPQLFNLSRENISTALLSSALPQTQPPSRLTKWIHNLQMRNPVKPPVPKKNSLVNATSPASRAPVHKETLIDALAKYASSDKKILISVVDLGFANMAINLYLTCMKPQSVSNYLIVAIHPDVCARLEPYSVNCFTYKTIQYSDKASVFNSKEYNLKTSSRGDVIIEALKAGYTVFHTDADAICFQNPFDYVDCPRGSCDIATMLDYKTDNYAVGCDLINPTPGSILIYESMKKYVGGHKVIDQKQFHNGINDAKKKSPNFKHVGMSMKQFVSGKAYYEDGRRHFADEAPPCSACVMVQNNWIVSLEAKRYRAKELHHWLYDGDRYYTSTDRKYLAFDNPLPAAEANRNDELKALHAALAMGKLLDRTVVIPKFHCGTRTCNLLNVMLVRNFDATFQYREHSFLTHPLVPDSVKKSVFGPVLIASDFITKKRPAVISNGDIKTFKPSDTVNGMDDKEVLKHFKSVTESVLKFHSLYNAFKGFSDNTAKDTFSKLLKKGITGASYMQFG